jgi:predicted phage terminase large subunit-like protein
MNSQVSPQAAASELLSRRIARESLQEFTLYTKPDYELNWHHALLCQYLDRFISGDIKRLMVFMPPRHGKSELVSRRLPAYILGKSPDASIISCSYSSDLASRMNRDVQRIIDSQQFGALFPGTSLNQKNIRADSQGSYLRNSDIFEIIGHSGVYRSAGVGGGITGMGMTVGIIDDPIKNREEANSTTYRDKLWEWYTSTFYTRLEKDAKLLITLTRWHEDDLAGRIQEQQKTEGSEEWTILRLPAIAERERHPDDIRNEGLPLWENKYDLQKLSQIKTLLGSYQWQALYQQNPTPEEGAMFKRTWWKFYDKAPKMDEIIQSWDCSFKDTDGSDYVAGQVWGISGANRYLLDWVHARLDFPGTIQALTTLSAKWPEAHYKLIEDKANGTAVIQVMKNRIPGLIPVEPFGGKIVRARAVTAEVEAGNVFLPSPELNPRVHDLIEELSAFPSGKYDDQVDALTQALSQFNKMGQEMQEIISHYPGEYSISPI